MSIESPTNREEFISHCKKRVSFLTVNITPDQEKILVEKAKKKFLASHRDATEKQFVMHLITPQDIANGFFVTPPEVWQVNNVLSYRSAVSMTAATIANIDASTAFFSGGTPTSNGWRIPIGPEDTLTSPIVNYWLAKQNASLYDSHFNREDLFRWSRVTRHIQIIGNGRLKPDHYLVYEAEMSLENEERFWQVEWFIEYTVNLFKKQWGENLTKFSNVELPGGITLSGPELKAEATERIKELEEELFSEHTDFQMIYIS